MVRVVEEGGNDIQMTCDICNKDIKIFPAGFWGRLHAEDGTVIRWVTFCHDCVRKPEVISEWVKETQKEARKENVTK